MKFHSEASVRTQHLLCVNSYFLFAYHLIQVPFRHCFFTLKILSADQQRRSRLTDVSLLTSPMLCWSQHMNYLELKKKQCLIQVWKKKIKYRQPKTSFSLKTVSLSVMCVGTMYSFIHACALYIIYQKRMSKVITIATTTITIENSKIAIYIFHSCVVVFFSSSHHHLGCSHSLFYFMDENTFGSMRHDNDNEKWKKIKLI